MAFWVLGCLVGLTGCAGRSATPAHRARQPPAHRVGLGVDRTTTDDQRCATTRCRPFTVSGVTPIPNTSSDPGSDQAQGDPGHQICAPARYRRAVREATEVALGAGLLGAPDGAGLMQHFLDGRGTPVTFGPTSRVSRLITRTAAFRRADRAVEAELGTRLVPLTARGLREPPAHIRIAPSLLTALRPDFDDRAREPDLYLSFRGTQGLSVRGSGRAYPSSRHGHAGYVSGRLVYVISDVYGYGSEPRLSILGHPVGPDLHYLQTTCGAPAHRHGAHWFRDAAIVIVHFRTPLA